MSRRRVNGTSSTGRIVCALSRWETRGWKKRGKEKARMGENIAACFLLLPRVKKQALLLALSPPLAWCPEFEVISLHPDNKNKTTLDLHYS